MTVLSLDDEYKWQYLGMQTVCQGTGHFFITVHCFAKTVSACLSTIYAYCLHILCCGILKRKLFCVSICFKILNPTEWEEKQNLLAFFKSENNSQEKSDDTESKPSKNASSLEETKMCLYFRICDRNQIKKSKFCFFFYNKEYYTFGFTESFSELSYSL